MPVRPSRADPRRCLVIGGGLAGLAAAVRLVREGFEVTVLERRGSLGGRTFSTTPDDIDDVLDNGQHVLASGFTNLFAYLEAIGTRSDVHFPGHLTIRMPDGRARRIGSDPLGVLRVVLGDVPGVTGLDRARTAIAQTRLVAQSIRQPDDLDQITAEQWFDRVGLPVDARRGLWDTVVIGLTGDKPDISSAKVPADLLVTGLRQALRTRRPISIGYPTVDLEALLVQPAVRFLEAHGATFRTRAVVEQILVDDGRLTGVRLSGGEVLTAAAVVCAVPVWEVDGMLDQVPGHRQITRVTEHLTPVPIVSVNLHLDRDIGMDDWGEVLYGGVGVLEQVWDRQRMHGRRPDCSWLYSTTVSAAYELTTASSASIVEQQMALLRRYYPVARDARVLHEQVVRMPRATFAQRPGTAGLRPSQRTAVDGLVLAGDWTDTDWTTTMEGAVQSAHRAVDVLIGDRTA